MHSVQLDVEDFHRALDVPVGDSPAIRRPELRASLIHEEARETIEAIERGDLIKAIDGMCDLLCVVYGTAAEFGVDLEPFWTEVHRTNMAKQGGPVREDGKRLKPPGWEPPRIAEILERGSLTRAQIETQRGRKERREHLANAQLAALRSGWGIKTARRRASMDKDAAIAIWASLEKKQYHLDDEEGETGGWDLPVFNVRLDAYSTEEEDPRDYRVRVTATGAGFGPEWWAEVIESAKEAEVDVAIQNNGIELS